MSSFVDNKEEEHPFFHYYGQLAHQQNMLQDDVRTGTYYKAVMDNRSDFAGKVVLDVGTGSGILAMFAARAGAKKVYAVEASDMADCARKLVLANGLEEVVEVIKGKVEEIKLPEKVDIIISEPMGFLLVHERMLESYVLARELHMKPNGGRMFPSTGTMYFLPFSDWSIFNEQTAKASFWKANNFYGFDISCLEKEATHQHFSQPVVGYFDPSIFIADEQAAVTHTLNFETITAEEMHTIEIPFEFPVATTSLMHGLACWFDVDFIGSTKTVKLTTSPNAPGTHWYQCRLLLNEPLAVNMSQVVTGKMVMKVNKKYSYDIQLECEIKGTGIRSTNRIKLHDQMYHYLQQPSGQDMSMDAQAGGGAYGAQGW